MKKLLYSLSFVITTFYLIASCTKIRTTQLGGSLIPAVDNVNVFDTTFDIISTVYELGDSTRIVPSLAHALGVLEDPIFGKTKADIYLQMEPTRFNGYPFGTSVDSIIGLDSVVLSLRYTSLYGDSNAVQSIKVYEIDQLAPFTDTTLGYIVGHPPFQASQEIGGRANIPFHTLNDSLTYIQGGDTINTVNELRIPISHAFGMKLINIDTTTYKYGSDSLFEFKVRGMAIMAEQSSAVKKALAYFNINDAAGTKLTFYYRRTLNAAPDTTFTTFVFNNGSTILKERNDAHANLIQRDTEGTPYGAQLLNGSTGNQSEIYLQSTPGSYSLLQIPGLQNISNRIIYKASLVVEQLEGYEENNFAVPSLLFLDAVDSANERFITIPRSFVYNQNATPLFYDPGTFGGFYANKKFEFDLAPYVQGIATRQEKSYALRLYAPLTTLPVVPTQGTNQQLLTINPRPAAGRTVVGGGAHPTKKLRLYIVYSNL